MTQSLITVFLTVLLTEFLAEFGDKTQFLLIGMTSKYKIRDIIIGTLAACLLLNGIAVFIGGSLNSVLNSYLWAVKVIATSAFFFFAVTALRSDDDDEEEAGDSKLKFAPLAVFCTFFVAELGDKTQLTAVTFGANYGLRQAVVVWLACTIGLFGADIVGMLIGYFLKAKFPDKLLKIVSFILFTGFGFYTAYEAMNLLQEAIYARGSNAVVHVWPAMGIIAVVFAGLCGLGLWLNKREKMNIAVIEE